MSLASPQLPSAVRSHARFAGMSAPDFTLRLATANDAAALSTFATRLFVETFGKDNTPDDMERYIRASFSTGLQAQEIAEPGAVVLLAFAAPPSPELRLVPNLAAYAHLGCSEVPAEIGDAEAVELKRFYVAKEWQGSGLATTLMREIMQHARASGARTLWLGVWEHNARAIAFYRKHGFRAAGSHEFLLGNDRQTDLLMTVPLDA
jgi:ribosomal protein S18 acetylase RimI-like enzyme